VKHLKLVIIFCAAVGLLELVLPVGGESLLWRLYELDPLEAVIYAAIFVLPLAMGALALARPPMLAWQAGVALAGFVLGVVRFRVWNIVLHLTSGDVHSLPRLAVVAGGTVAAVAVLMKPEQPPAIS